MTEQPRAHEPAAQQHEHQHDPQRAELAPGTLVLAAPAPARAPERSSRRQTSPAVAAAAVAAGGFVAGAAVAGLVHRRQRQSTALARGNGISRALARAGTRKAARAPERLEILSSHTLLVDVHVLGVPGLGS